ncbi:MAG: hypothetical protein M0Q91_17215 [Methanoregula sp.]|jgi:hypothetical protein|nr:hypothetical protein [Methanoregula sp.]
MNIPIHSRVASSDYASQPPGVLAKNNAAMMIALGAEPDFCGSANRESDGEAVYREPDAEDDGGSPFLIREWGKIDNFVIFRELGHWNISGSSLAIGSE